MDIRLATDGDASDILLWRNDQISREMSLNSSIVSKEEHAEWFLESITNPNRTIYIGLIHSFKVGVCRFDLNPLNLSAEISITLNPVLRGKGLSYQFLMMAIEEYRKSHHADLLATIKNDNLASMRIFTRFGFREVGSRQNFKLFKLSPE